jgi:hypothetical protein
MKKLLDHGWLLNGKTTAIISFVVIIVTAIIVFIVSKRPLYDELEITISIIAFALFLFLTYGLYNGAAIIDKPIFPKFKQLNGIDFTGGVIDFEISQGIGGLIGSIILWIFFSIVMVILITLFLTVIWSAILIFSFILYWLFFRAMRLVFLKSPECKGNLGMSFKYSFVYSLLYTGWILGIIMISKYFSTRGI